MIEVVIAFIILAGIIFIVTFRPFSSRIGHSLGPGHASKELEDYCPDLGPRAKAFLEAVRESKYSFPTEEELTYNQVINRMIKFYEIAPNSYLVGMCQVLNHMFRGRYNYRMYFKIKTQIEALPSYKGSVFKFPLTSEGREQRIQFLESLKSQL